MRTDLQRRRSEGAVRRRTTLIKKVHEYGRLYDADVTLIICLGGRHFAYTSVDKDNSWPSMEQMVSSPPQIL